MRGLHFTDIMDPPRTFDNLKDLKGLKLVHLNARSLLKKMDQLRLLTTDSEVDILSISETWLKPHLSSDLLEISGYKTYRLDRVFGPTRKKLRGGGLVTYVSEEFASMCEPLIELNRTDENVEALWTFIHRPNCKNVVVCNLYRPPEGNLKKALEYLDDCLKSLNVSKLNMFLMGDWNVNYKNKQSPGYTQLNFFSTSNGLTQHIVQSIYKNYWHNLKQIATEFFSAGMHSGEVSL